MQRLAGDNEEITGQYPSETKNLVETSTGSRSVKPLPLPKHRGPDAGGSFAIPQRPVRRGRAGRTAAHAARALGTLDLRPRPARAASPGWPQRPCHLARVAAPAFAVDRAATAPTAECTRAVHRQSG